MGGFLRKMRAIARVAEARDWVSLLQSGPFDSTAADPDPSWYAYTQSDEPNTETVADGTEQSTGEPDPAWTNGGYQIGYAQLPVYAKIGGFQRG